MSKEWLNTYETLCDMVVPGTSTLVHSDDECNLFSVTVFRKKVSELAANATAKKYPCFRLVFSCSGPWSLLILSTRFVVREFEWDPKQMSADKKRIADLTSADNAQFNSLVKLTGTAFSEVFSMYIHIKVMIVFVESVLRYGPPTSLKVFEPILVKLKDQKCLQKVNALLELQISKRSSMKPMKYYEKQKEILSKEGIVINMSEVESSLISSVTIDCFT